RNFPSGRMQIQECKDFIIFNDAYNANPYSFVKALQVVRKIPLRKIAVIGDMLELGKKSIYYHRVLANEILKTKFDYVLTMGEYTPYLKEKLKELGYRRAFHFSSHKEIAQFIKEKVPILSPHPSKKFSTSSSQNPKERRKCLIFLKGSRKMELGKVIDFLRV
ncbi:MAG: hypothetical protein JSW40_07195, partial [Candidatus Omnitrophota bacterium]